MTRAAVLSRTTELLRTAAMGQARALVVEGELGMGKTSFVDEVRAAAHEREFDVVETRGSEADAELGFSALLTLLRPFDRELDELAAPFADDLRAALTLGPRQLADESRVRLALYRVVTSLAERKPLLVLVDDAHHLDAATSDALAFVVGRLAQDCVATVFASDGDLPAALADLALPVEPLRALTDAELAALVTSEVGDVSSEALQQCCALANGNPLIALELARSLSDGERAGTVAISLRPKLPTTLARRFAMRFEAFDPVATRALAVAAADDTGRSAVVRSALAELGEPADALDRAEQTGVIETDGPTVAFTHPLLKVVAYHRVAPASRRAAHRALAVALADPDDAVARAWQLAAAAEGEDERAAEALTLVAGDLARRGAAPSAARVYQRAAALTPDRSSRSLRALLAAECWLDAFTPDAAATALTDVVVDDDNGVLVGALTVERWTRGPVAALERIRVIGDGARGPLARALEADLLFDAVGERPAMELARQVIDDPLADDAARAVAEVVIARASAGVIDGREPVRTDRRLDAFMSLRRWQCATEFGTIECEAPAARSLEASLAAALAARHHGDVVGAYDRLQVEAGLVPERATRQRALLDLALADVEQLLGRSDDGRGRLVRALGTLSEHELGLAAPGRWVLGRLTLAAGDAEQGCAVLEAPARARPSLYGAELAVALVGLGRVAAAERVMTSAVNGAHVAGVAAARVARAHAAFRGDDNGFVHATEVATRARLPIEVAETLLAHAEHVNRDGRRDDACKLASQALDEFDRCGVRGWDPRISRLVDGSTSGGGIASELTSAEYRVALAVSNGATNREAASALFLSVKTVDFHLQNIYRKLGLRSRTELAVRLRGDSAVRA